ncbi:uncharacterized protein [Mytilus edulis]|uniref:uncharacterized protein isoform X2 n=1 Tax=Mytilus edulis TaxID=6550 RepID=UPI0039F0F348
MTENSDSGSSNGSEPSSVESREEQIAYSSGDSIGSQFPSGSTNLEKNCEKKKELEQNGKKEKKLERNRKRKKNCRLRIFVLTMIISGCVSGVAAWIIHNNYFLGLNETPPPKKDNLLDFPDKCDSNISSVTVGEPICITLTEEFTSSPSRIHVRQMSSQYLGSLQSFSVNVSIDPFVQHNEDVIIGYNSSRTNKEFRFALKKATCDNVGKYNITFEYSDGKVKSLKWKFRLEEPTLKHSVNRINDSIHIRCEMKNNCKTGSLNLFVNDGDSSRMIPTMNDCSIPDRKSSSKIIAEAIIPLSWFSGNQTISCVPLMTDQKLAANLTSTMGIPICEGDSCKPNCEDDPYGIAYFQDKHLCNIFYQCSNGDIFLQKCLKGTSWSHSKCTCVHFDIAICDWKTFKFFQPAMSFEKCTKLKQV